MLRRYSLLFASAMLAASASAQTPAPLSAEDLREIRALSTLYVQALGSCDAETYAELFVPETGYFQSRYRGEIVGRDLLIAMVQSERRCVAPAGSPERQRPPSSANSSPVEIDATASGARGFTDLGDAGEYHDDYVRTLDGWRFASRIALKRADIAAGLTPRDLSAIHRLGAANPAASYCPDQNGIERLRVSGVAISTTDDGVVSGRAYVQGGGYNADIYEKTADGSWRIKSRAFVPDACGDARARR